MTAVDHAHKSGGTVTYAITGARVFDGENVIDAECVVIDGGVIAAVGDRPPAGAEVIDGHGSTLLPGLIDAHVHTDEARMNQALRFGVTSVCEMGSPPRLSEERLQYAGDDTLADLRSAGVPVTAPYGHPNVLILGREKVLPKCGCNHGIQAVPGIESPEAIPGEIAERVRQGSDWIKVIAEEGTVFGEPGQPVLPDAMYAAVVDSSHGHRRMAIAHAMTYDTTWTMLDSGIDGLAHTFLDRPHTQEIVSRILGRDVFVIPTLAIIRAMVGETGDDLAADPRVASRLSEHQLGVLRGTFATYPDGDFETVLATVRALHEAGVQVLAGSDSFGHDMPYGGVVSGASLHHELQLLVSAGISPVDVLRMATSAPADVFGLTDRGRIREGARADLVLVDGDPTVDISATLSTQAVWRRGIKSTPLSD